MICQELQSGPCCSGATEGSVERHCAAVATPLPGNVCCRVTDDLHAHKFGQMSTQRDFFMKYCLIVFSFCFNQSKAYAQTFIWRQFTENSFQRNLAAGNFKA